jgi:integrase/recombinase XerD
VPVVTFKNFTTMFIDQNLTAYQLKDANQFFASMKYNFFLKNQPDKNGVSPVYLNIDISGKRKRIPIDLKIEPKHWDKENRRFVGFERAKDYNLILEQISGKITNIKIQHRLSEIPLTLENFTEQLKNAPPNYDLVQFFFHVIETQDLGAGTKTKHIGIFNKIKESKVSAMFADLNYAWFDKYRAYLRKIGNNASTINTNISIIKRYLKLAKDYGIKIYVDLDKVKVGPTAGRIIWLNATEIEKLEDYYFSKFIPEHLKLSLGYFLFSCFCGLRISDVYNRSRKEIEADFLDFISIKTQTHQIIKINNKCRKIIEANEDLFIEKRSEVTVNYQLVNIMKACGIRKHVSFHVARHSFATNYLLNGGKVENLQVLLGHSKITTTMKYVHIIKTDAAMTTDVFD